MASENLVLSLAGPEGSFFFDPCFLTNAITQVKQACATHFTFFQYFNVRNNGRRKWEDTLYAYPIGNFSDGEGFSSSLS